MQLRYPLKAPRRSARSWGCTQSCMSTMVAAGQEVAILGGKKLDCNEGPGDNSWWPAMVPFPCPYRPSSGEPQRLVRCT